MLHLIYVESLEPIKVFHAFTSTYISDHHLVGTELQMKKKLVRIESSKTRNYKNFTPIDFAATFNNEHIIEQDEFGLAVQELEQKFTRTLDELAPLEDRKKEGTA